MAKTTASPDADFSKVNFMLLPFGIPKGAIVKELNYQDKTNFNSAWQHWIFDRF
ncbi:hypothetical protein [Duganella rhizosphaerae]|uniref:hypothetical protein n=1 Tax=Duganella rhizosphaerae TaxID=2885763 RepID=UPI00403F089F